MRKRFLDVGANVGTHVRKLFEPEKYPGSPYLKVFHESFGTPEHRARPTAETGICAFGFEANPRHAARLQEISKAYNRKGWHVRFFSPLAAGDNSGSKLTFHLNDDNKDEDWGASAVTKFGDGGTDVEVPQFDLAGYMKAMTDGRPAGFSLMKMDIEGSEYKVLPGFLSKSILCQKALNKLTIEWHRRFLSWTEVPYAALLEWEVKKPNNTWTKNCADGDKPTEVSEIDDESYLQDGAPLP